MSATDQKDTQPLTREFPFTCPKCEKRAGFPIGMTTEGRDREVIVARCRECAHMWQLQRQPSGPISRRW